MRRTQLYLDDDLWLALHARSRALRTSISELVREAVRDRYLGDLERRRKAMQGIVGIWKDKRDLPDTESYLRKLRRGSRIERHGAP